MAGDLGVVPLAAPLPSVVVLDTSAVVCALLGDQPQHEEHADFLTRAISVGTAFVYCDLLDFELADVSMTIALKRRHGRAWFRHRDEEEDLASWTMLIVGVGRVVAPVVATGPFTGIQRHTLVGA